MRDVSAFSVQFYWRAIERAGSFVAQKERKKKKRKSEKNDVVQVGTASARLIEEETFVRERPIGRRERSSN